MGRELPILFNTNMVRAILDRRKTVTREFSETELKYTKEEIEELCARKNREMAGRREDWLLNGLPAIRRFQNFGI